MDDNSDIMLLTLKLFVVCMPEGLEFTRPELDILHYIHKGIKDPVEEPITKAAEQLWKFSTQSLHSREWSNQDGLLYFHSCIYVPLDSDLCCHIISLCHDTKVASHVGVQNPRTGFLQLLVAQYVAVCWLVCLDL
jgi:hypothetical protein